MKNKKQDISNEQAKMKKKVNILNDIFEGTALFGGISAFMALMILLLGGASEIGANAMMDSKSDEIYNSSGYQIFAEEGLSQLDKKLASGEISMDKYNEGVDALYSVPEIIRYAETAKDEELSEFIDSYNTSKEYAEGALTRGLPVFGTLSAVTLAGAAVTSKSAKKARKEFEEAGGTFEEEQSMRK